MFDERPTGMRSRSLLHPVITKWQTLPANVRIKEGGRMRGECWWMPAHAEALHVLLPTHTV